MGEKMQQLVLTKIVATLGPASADVGTMMAMIEEGVRVFRINFSHGKLEDFGVLIKNVREASKRSGRYVGALGDLSGPKLRVGQVIDGGITLKAGESIRLTSETVIAGESDGEPTFSVNNPGLIDEVRPNERVLIDDGAVALKCTAAAADNNGLLKCEVLHGGLVTSAKGVNLPDTALSLPSLTEWDHRCIDYAVEMGFDFLALSFVRSAADVVQLKERLRELGARPQPKSAQDSRTGQQIASYGRGSESFIPIVAKIEKPQALDDLEAIVDETDVIMVARGDLGVEMEPEEVPICQKKIIRSCHHHGKPVIVATQMLQSMIKAPIPTRAETSDVANAIFDGADAVMLSGETAVGSYPVESVRMMRRIARRTNEFRKTEGLNFDSPSSPRQSRYRPAALARGVKAIAQDLDARLIVMWSQTGGGASYLSQNKLAVPIVAYSSSSEALRRLSVLYGVAPRFMDKPASTAEFIKAVDAMLIENQWAAEGDAIVIVLGEPIGQSGLTNKIRVHYVGDI
ncbi:MAG: pyruvate kinase [Limisphaerales bacterium]|jgi:pyruvate kinase